MDTIEHAITGGRVIYIYALGYDAHRRELTLVCLSDPPNKPVRTVVFRDIVGYDDLWDDEEAPDPELIDTIIGLDCRRDAQTEMFNYTLRTASREIRFASRRSPEIVEHRNV